MIGLFGLLILVVLPNAILFGLAFLIARRFCRDSRPRLVAWTALIALLIAFGPRLPGMLGDAHYAAFGDRTRLIQERVALREGDIVGFESDVLRRDGIPPAADADSERERSAELLFRLRYLPVVGFREYSPISMAARSERPRWQLLSRFGLMLDERSPASRDVRILLHGRESARHFRVSVVVMRGDREVARFADRFRTRWPGMPRNGTPWFGLLLQNSILDDAADALYAGRMVQYRHTGPVAAFLDEVFEVTPAPEPVAETAATIVHDIDPEALSRRPVASKVQSPSECTPGPADLQWNALVFSQEGITGRRDPELTIDGEAYPLRATACLPRGLATLHTAKSGMAGIVALRNPLRDVDCALHFELPVAVRQPSYRRSFLDFRVDDLGFRADILLEPRNRGSGETRQGQHLHVVNGGSCLSRLSAGPAQAEASLDGARRRMAEVIDSLKRYTGSHWAEVVDSEQRAWERRVAAQCAAGERGDAATNARDGKPALPHCRYFAGEQRIATLGKLLRLAQRDYEVLKTLGPSELLSLGRLRPQVLKVTGPPARADHRPQAVNETTARIDIAEADAPAILQLDARRFKRIVLRRSADVWLLGVTERGRMPRRTMESVETQGFSFPDGVDSNFNRTFAQLDVNDFALPDDNRLTIGSADLPMQRERPAAPVAPGGGPDRYDRMVAEAIAESPRPVTPGTRMSFAPQDLRRAVARMPANLLLREVHGLWAGDKDVVVDIPGRSVLLLLQSNRRVDWSVSATPGTRLLGLLLDDGSGEQRLARRPAGVPVYTLSASGNFWHSDFLRQFAELHGRLPDSAFRPMTSEERLVLR